MGRKKFNFYRFLPVQLFLLHFRKYQLLLVFWLVLLMTIRGHFAAHFGAASLFLSPEYLGTTNSLSFFLLGGATAIFTMSWHITTFIIHSNRVPFLGATRQAFVKYWLNNSILPLIYLIVFSFSAGYYLYQNENYDVTSISVMLLGFYLGYILILLVSFLYFFRVDRNILKTLLGSIGNLTAITGIIPFDSLDTEVDQVHAHTYLSGRFTIKEIKRPYRYNARFLAAVLRRHHRNAVFAIVVAYIVLLVLGIFMEHPVMRIPAACGFLLLFSIILAIVCSFKYLLRSWEIIGWIAVFLVTSFMTHKGIFDIRSVAYGIKYKGFKPPAYNYANLKATFDSAIIQKDIQQEKLRLERWKKHTNQMKPPLIILSVSGGGSRSAYWSFRCLQYADSLLKGKLFQNTVFMTGASGGIIGSAFWRAVHTEAELGQVDDVYASKYQEDIGKDLLNAIVFSMASVDFISPFNKITIDGQRYGKDRGFAFDEELKNISEGFLDKSIGDYKSIVAAGRSPLMVINGTIINDGRKLMIASQPISYLTAASYYSDEKQPVVDAVDFSRFFQKADPMDLQLSSALRMGATFPIVLPVVKLPSKPQMEVMDAGLRDNYGMETGLRYLDNFRNWMLANCGNIILLQIRDTRETAPSTPDSGISLSSLILEPLFAIQQKWSSFQTFSQTYLLDEAHYNFPKGRFHKIVLEFAPSKTERAVALNFHLSDKDKKELLQSVYSEDNQKAFEQLIQLVQKDSVQ